MSSPFPGMDPYLQNPAFWLDFHSTFINYWREAVADALPDHYDASINERVYLVEEDPDARKLIVPDVAVLHDRKSAPARPGAGVATLEPITVPLALAEGVRENYVEILHRSDRSLVAVLELLSPTNKLSPGREEYLLKRNAILRQQVHLVELDLLKAGLRPPLRRPWPAGDCGYLVSRHESRPDAQVYVWSIREPLPTLPIPLKSPDADILIALAEVFRTAYDRGRFARRLRYGEPCPTELSADDRAWADEILK